MKRLSAPTARGELGRRLLLQGYGLLSRCYGRYCRHRWVRGLLRPLTWVARASFNWLEQRAEARFERRYGIRTTGIIFFDRDPSAKQDAEPYEATPYGILEKVLDALELTADDVFVDIGCGKGRVVCQVATRRLRKVIGVEVVPDLVDDAKRNVAQITTATPVEIIHGDAATSDVSDGTIFYLYNPFGEDTLAALLWNIKASLTRHPRPVRIVYTNPSRAHVLDAQDWLRPTWAYQDAVRVWEAASG